MKKKWVEKNRCGETEENSPVWQVIVPLNISMIHPASWSNSGVKVKCFFRIDRFLNLDQNASDLRSDEAHGVA